MTFQAVHRREPHAGSQPRFQQRRPRCAARMRGARSLAETLAASSARRQKVGEKDQRMLQRRQVVPEE